MFKRCAFVPDVLFGIGFDSSFSTITKRLAPKWKTFVCEQSGASGMIEELVTSARRLVVVALTPADTDYVMALADQYPHQIDGVVLHVEADQADKVGDWRRQTKFGGLCKFRADDAEYMARSLGTMLANIDAFSSRVVTPGRIIQLR